MHNLRIFAQFANRNVIPMQSGFNERLTRARVNVTGYPLNPFINKKVLKVRKVGKMLQCSEKSPWRNPQKMQGGFMLGNCQK